MPVVYSKRGQAINFDDLSKANEKSVALGNARMNAKGDKLGSGGKVAESREDQNKKYRATQAYAENAGSVQHVNLASKKIIPDDIKIMSPQEALAKQTREAAKIKKQDRERAEAEYKASKEVFESDEPAKPTEETTQKKRKIIDSDE